MSYRPISWPSWVRGLVAGLVWAAFMLVVLPLGRGGALHPGTVVAVVVGGVLFGGMMAFVLGRAEKRLFPGDRPLDGDERVAVARAVREGEPPAEPGLRDVARRVAEQRAGRPRRLWLTVAVVAVLTAVTAFHALTGSPWWWLGVAFWPALGLVSVRSEDRARAVARRYLDAPA